MLQTVHGYLSKVKHPQNTQSIEYLLKIPNLRTEFAKKSAMFLWRQKCTITYDLFSDKFSNSFDISISKDFTFILCLFLSFVYFDINYQIAAVYLQLFYFCHFCHT